MHRVRTVSVAGTCYSRCLNTNETVLASTVLEAYQKLNKLCACKHKAAYSAEEAQRKWEEAQFMRVAQTKQVDRRSIEQLNAQVEREYRR